MTRRYTRITIASLLLLTGISSCSKSFLEVEPKGKLIAQSVNDYDQLLNNLYVVYINSNAQTPMGDELVAAEPFFSQAETRTQRLFRWDDDVYNAQEDAPELNITMQNIYSFNKIINEIDEATDGTDAQKKAVKAEAMAGRAWTNFLLINYYGLPYNNQTSATDAGFPIITNADVTQNRFVRATVKEMYDFIVSDLTQAIPSLPGQITTRFRMSKAAAEGILGKVYMFMGRYEQALPLLDSALTHMNNNSIGIGLYNLPEEFATGKAYAGTNAPNIAVDIENILGKQSSNNWSRTYNELLLSPEAASLYQTSDWRLNFYTNTATNGQTYAIPGALRKNRFGTFKFGVLVPDLYLLRAECRCRLNNLAGAKQDVETVRAKRMTTNISVPETIATQSLPLLRFILNERIREFAVMGYRWFDMRRLTVDPLFAGTTFTHTLYEATGAVKAVYTLKPARLVLRFPAKILAQSNGLTDNP